jgi:two-component sensor histidine kinase
VDDRGGEHAPEPADMVLEPVAVPSSKAAPLALIVNELLTYALASGPSERLRLSVDRTDGQFSIRVEGQGSPGASDPFGKEIVNLLARQLRADTSFEERDGVRRASLTLPVEGGLS